MQEKHQSVASHKPPAGDLVHNPGMCLDWELNQQPFGLWDNAQATKPHQLGLEGPLQVIPGGDEDQGQFSLQETHASLGRQSPLNDRILALNQEDRLAT